MARRLSPVKRDQLDAMIQCDLSTADIAKVIGCSERTIQRKRKQHLSPPEAKASPSPLNPFTPVGRASHITPYMQEILRKQLERKPDMYQCEMATFLYKRSGVVVSSPTVCRGLKAMRYSVKTGRRVAKQRDDTLRDYYSWKVSQYEANQLIFVDESGCDKKAGQRRRGWAPIGKTPVMVDALNRDKRYQILPAYAVDGILLTRIYTGSTDAELFEDFIMQLLQHCGRWPEPKSVLVMDNASWHQKERIEELCAEAGVKVLFLPPYSPDFNPIEEFFAELKAYIKKHWDEYEALIKIDFKCFLRLCVNAVGSRKESAEGHFRHAGIVLDKYYK
ncbi:transposase [Paramyrothecium foliicola]|nr:transposase [Paramyrothecium foliicola]